MSEELKFSPKSFANLFQKIDFKKIHNDSTDVFDIQEYKLTPIRLDVHLITPFFFPKKNLSAHKSVPKEMLLDFLLAAQAYIKKLGRKFGVLVINNEAKEVEEIIEDFSSSKIVLLARPDLEAIFNLNDQDLIYDRLGLLFTKYLGRDFLNPYITGRPAIGGRFYARSKTIAQIMGKRSHIIISGIRRVGKTSLLHVIAERLKSDHNYRIIELYGGTCKTLEDVLYRIYMALGMDKPAKEIELAGKIFLTSSAVNDFQRHILTEIRKETKPIAFLIDEFDQLIEIDEKRDFRLIEIFREMSGHEAFLFFFAGFRRTKESVARLQKALHNFGNLFLLKPFSRQETYDMIKIPLTRLGIEIEEDLPETIYSQTGGLPELIQIYCAEILILFNEYGKAPSAQQLLLEVANSPEFKFKIESSFLANANPHEQLICYLIIQEANKSGKINIEFGKEDIYRLLAAKHVRLISFDLQSLIENLEASAIIEKCQGTDATYEFRVPQLINYIKQQNLEFEIERTLEDIEEHTVYEDVKPPEQATDKII